MTTASAAAPAGQARAVFYMMVAAMAATLGNSFIKFVAVDLHPFEITFFRSFFSLFVLAPMLLRRREKPGT